MNVKKWKNKLCSFIVQSFASVDREHIDVCAHERIVSFISSPFSLFEAGGTSVSRNFSSIEDNVSTLKKGQGNTYSFHLRAPLGPRGREVVPQIRIKMKNVFLSKLLSKISTPLLFFVRKKRLVEKCSFSPSASFFARKEG